MTLPLAGYFTLYFIGVTVDGGANTSRRHGPFHEWSVCTASAQAELRSNYRVLASECYLAPVVAAERTR